MSGLRAGRATTLVTCLVMITAGCDRYDPDAHPTLPADQFTTLTLTPANTTADGASTIYARLDIPMGASADRRSVTFATSVGSFSDGSTKATVNADGDGHAIVLLKAPLDVSAGIVTATAGDATQIDSVRFQRAYPEGVSVSTKAFAVGASPANETEITVTLFRVIGVPSTGIVPQVAVTDTAGNQVGRLGSIPPSDRSGGSTIRYSPLATTYRGTVTITVHVPSDAAGGQLNGAAMLEVVDP